MKIRNIYNQTTAPTIQDLWLYKGDLRYFGNKGWTSLFPDYTKNFEDIATQIDEINKQLDTIESTTADIGVLADKIGSNTYTDANYISKETNLTDAALQLDEEIKATNDNLAILNAATIKGVKVGSNTTNEPVENGIVTIAPADVYKDGVMTSTMVNNLNSGYTCSIQCRQNIEGGNIGIYYYNRNPMGTGAQVQAFTGIPEVDSQCDGTMPHEVYNRLNRNYLINIGSKEEASDGISYPINLQNPITGTTSGNYLVIPNATRSAIGLMSTSDKIKLDSIINTGDGTKFLADDFTYKTIQMPDLSTYATKSELSDYLPLSGGTMTGSINMNGDMTISSLANTLRLEDTDFLQFVSDDAEVDVISLRASSVDMGWVRGGETGHMKLYLMGEEIYLEGNEAYRKTGSDTYTIYDSGNFIAGTDYLAPGGVSIADVSGLQDSLDGKVNTTGDSYKNNNACWGGTRPNGTQTCLLYIDTNGNNKLSNCYGGTYLRASAPHTLFLEVGTPGSMDDSVFYSIYNEGNFKAGTNYVAPSTLNNYLPLSGGTLTGLLNLDITSVTSTSYNEGIRISEAANGWSTLVLGTNGSSSGSTSTQFSIARNPANTLVIVSSSNTSLSETSTVTPAKGLGITQDNTDLTFNGNHVITKADTFNTITYTTSASEDNLRAWNNYVNGYVTNLRISDSSYTEILMSTGVNQTSKVVYATQFSVTEGTSSFTLNVLSYTIADDGSVTKTMNSGTISSGGAN